MYRPMYSLLEYSFFSLDWLMTYMNSGRKSSAPAEHPSEFRISMEIEFDRYYLFRKVENGVSFTVQDLAAVEDDGYLLSGRDELVGLKVVELGDRGLQLVVLVVGLLQLQELWRQEGPELLDVLFELVVLFFVLLFDKDPI